MQRLEASFASQEQAEAAVRKLASLRGNRFRLSRAGAGESGGEYVESNAQMNAVANALLYGGTELEMADEPGSAPGGSAAAAFTLSVDVPAEAAEQARQVVTQAGGSLI